MPLHNKFGKQKDADPNPNFTFIRSLGNDEEALALLRALAAQVKPICKAHGFGVNSFEEYEWNSVFAGRNWNAGEVIEIVLRRPNGSFCPTGWLVHVVCHELAHIKHMNHGPGFQKLNAQLRKEVRELQQKGYFGDGMWSNGKRLSDGAAIQGEGVQAGVDVPEQLCGGASKISKKRRYRRRRPTSTGSPTKRRKAGGRIRRKDAFVGDGQAVSADPAQSSFRRRTQSKAGGEARAVAAERRARHEARRQRGEPSDTDAAPDDEEDGLESEGDGGEKPLFRDEGSTTEEEDEDIEVSAEDKRWLKKEASDALLDDFWQKPSKASTSETPASKGKDKVPVVIDLDSDDVDPDNDSDLPDAGCLPPGKKRSRPSEAVASTSKSTDWACTACTYLNTPARKKCEVCNCER